MTTLWLDFETRSRCDLRSRGVYNYAQDRSTSVLCMSYAFDDDEVVTWTPDQPFPRRVAEHTGQIRAHNAAFERLIFWFVLCPDQGIREPSLAQFYCTATQARANCAPGSLEDVGRFSGATMKKDHRGSQLIRLLSVPRADGAFNDDPALMAEMVAYCEQDVRAMRAISRSLRDLSAEELADYHVNERINDRGVRVDLALCNAAVRYASDELVEIQQIVAEVTQGAITSVRSPKMRQWVWDRVGPEARKLMMVEDKTIGDKIKKTEKIYAPMVSRDEYSDSALTTKLAVLERDRFKVSIDKNVRANLLTFASENPDEVPHDVAEVIQCADDLWASSVAKFSRLAALADDEDHRVRGAFVFAGGAATGRASSYGAQVHNFARKCAKEPTETREAMVRGHKIVPQYGRRVTDVLKGMLRPALLASDGNWLAVADWSSIEARVNPWLSGRGDAKLELFRSGRDVYKVNAMATFRVEFDDVTPDQRQVGKVQELACGFAGGVGAFAAMGRVYGLALPEPEAKRMVDGWRKANTWALPFWQNLEEAYTRAMRHKGHEFTAGRITYLFDGVHLWYALPSGRVLCYPFARLETEGVTYAKASWKPAADAKEWPRARLWKGLACENVTQATANDLLRYSLRMLDAEGFEPVLHVHDEIVLETDDPDRTVEAMKRVMCSTPTWAEGIPLGIEAHTMRRYGKG
jgi:DNA polymerase